MHAPRGRVGLGLIAVGFLAWPPGVPSDDHWCRETGSTCAAPLVVTDSTTDRNGFVLAPTQRYSAASGHVTLVQPWSPFGITVAADGRVMHELTVAVTDLPPLTGDSVYIGWLATPDLSMVEAIGPVTNGTNVTVPTRWNKLLVVVTAEPHAPGAAWSGPIVLSGRTRSALLQPLWGHSLFQRIQMD